MTSETSASTEAARAQIGVTGLAVMGSNIARNFARHGHTVALHNRSIAKTDALLPSTATRATSSAPRPSRSSSARCRSRDAC